MHQQNLLKAYIALAAVCLLWGTTYLALRIGVESIPPFFFTGVRQSTAGLILISLFIFLKSKLTKQELWIHIISGVLMITLGNGLVAWAEKFVSSGIASLICALLPFWVVMVNLMTSNAEPLNWRVWLGMILGWVGLMMIFGDNLADFTNTNYTLGIVAIFIANFAWASGTVLTKNIKRTANPLLGAGIQLFFGGVFSFMISFMLEDLSNPNFTADSLWALAYLIVFGSIAAFGCFLYALSKLPAALTSIYAYINPMVAIFLGWLVLNEKLNIIVGISFVITIVGVFLVNQGFRTKKVIKTNTMQIAE